MGLMTFLCRVVGVCCGFVIPVVGGLYAASVGNVKQTNYFLRALVIWVIIDGVFSPILSAVFGVVSTMMWPLTFCLTSIALVVPRTRVLEHIDGYVISVINNGSLNSFAGKCKDLLQPLRCKVEKLVEPLVMSNNEDSQ